MLRLLQINKKDGTYFFSKNRVLTRVTEPPFLLGVTDDKIRQFLRTEHPRQAYLSHTQGVERGVKLTTESVHEVKGHRRQVGEILLVQAARRAGAREKLQQLGKRRRTVSVNVKPLPPNPFSHAKRRLFSSFVPVAWYYLDVQMISWTNTVNVLIFTVYYYSCFFSKIKIRENSYREISQFLWNREYNNSPRRN